MPFTAPDEDIAAAAQSSQGFTAPAEDEQAAANDPSTAEALAEDPTYDPIAEAAKYPEESPQWNLAYKVDAKRKETGKDATAPTLGQKALSAVKGVGQMLAGPTLASINAERAAANQYILNDAAAASRAATVGALELQNAEQGAKSTAGVLSTLKAALGGTDSAGNSSPPPITLAPGEGLDALKAKMTAQDKQFHVSDADKVQNFRDKVQDFKTQSGLAQGQVQNEGILNAATQALKNEPASSAFDSPQTLAWEGAPLSKFDLETAQAGGASANPANLAFEAAPAVPGVSTVLKTMGKAAQVVGDAGTAVVKSPLAKFAAYGAGAGGAAYAFSHGLDELKDHPVAALGALGLGATIALAKFGAPLLGNAGKIAAGEALPETVGAASTRISQGLAGATGGAAIGAATNPEDPTQGALSGAAFGGAMGLVNSPRPVLQASSTKAMADFGAKLKTGTPFDEAHDETMSAFSPDAQAAINRLRAHLYSDNPVNLLVLDEANFNDATQHMGGQGGERGAFTASDPYAISSDGRTIYLNADAIAGEGNTVDAARHEVGHAVVDYLQRAGESADAARLAEAITKTMSPADVADIQKAYGKALGANISADQAVQENVAEITRKILSGEDISNFALPKPFSEKLADVAGQFFNSFGFGKTSDSQGMKFGTKNVAEAARQMRNALYEQGAAAKEARTSAPEAPFESQKLQDVYQQLSALNALPAGKRPADTQDKIDALEAQKEKLEQGMAGKSENPALQPTPQAPAPSASAPNQPQGGSLATMTPATPPKPYTAADVSGAMQSLGVKKSEADQWGAAAQEPTLAEAVSQALAKRSAQKQQPTTQNPPLRNFEEAKPQASNEPEPQTTPSVATAAQEGTQAPNPPDAAPAGNGAETENPYTPPDSDAISAAMKRAAEAAQEKAAKARGGKKVSKEEKVAQITKEAQLGELGKLLPETGEGLHRETDPITGETTIKGDIDPTNPLHAEILKASGTSPEAIKNVTDAQELKGEGVYLRDYNSAKQEGFETGEGLDPSATKRQEEYQASPASERATGEGETSKQDKAFTPFSTVLTKSGPMIRGFDHDKFLENLRKVIDYGEDNGIPTGFEGLKGADLDNAVKDAFQKIAANQKNGYKGTGEPMQDFPAGGIKPNPDYAPQEVNEDQARAINMAINNQSAKMPSEPSAKTEAAKKRFAKAAMKSREATGRAELNSGFLDPETGETNQLRAAFEDNGFDTNHELKPTISNVRPDLIEGGIAPEAGHGKVVHAHGFDISPQDLTAQGTGDSRIQAAGFMPKDESGVAEEAAKKGYSEQKPLTAKDVLASVRNASGNSIATTKGPLKAVQNDLEENARASAEFGLGFHAARDNQLSALAKSARANGLAIGSLPAEWNAGSSDNLGGGEHDVFRDAEAGGGQGRWVKLGKPSGGFGYYPAARKGDSGVSASRDMGGWGLRAATPLEYLDKLQGLKEQFGIDTQIHGVESGHRDMTPRFVTSQPHVEGTALDDAGIEQHMKESGFARLPPAPGEEKSVSYYNPEKNTLIADAHPGNMIRLPDGTMSSFDSIVMHPGDDLKNVLLRQLGIGSKNPEGLAKFKAFMAQGGEAPQPQTIKRGGAKITIHRSSDGTFAETPSLATFMPVATEKEGVLAGAK